ncbi:MAG: methyltransferase domain-containing protein [Clostridiales bacterium]|nr:methyltransferase domain-containing protein [Clostridiales bacterium]
MSYEKHNENDITQMGNPAKPQGEAGKEMLIRMNDSHFEVTGWALSFFNFKDYDTILDIGCGGGLTLNRISKKVPNGKIYGVDYSDISVSTSKETNAEDISSGKAEILKASVENLPFENDFFEKIITVESFYFWPEPIENLREVRRILKPDGQFLLVADIYNRDDLPQHAKENIAKYKLRNPSIEEFHSMFEKAGFSEISIHTKTGTSWICVEGKKRA